MRIIVDIDGTVCSNTNGKYHTAEPFPGRIEKINKLFDEGNEVIYFTARGMNRFKGNIQEVYSAFYEMTRRQLNEWGCKYTQLWLGKQVYDLWIDDKSQEADMFFANRIDV